MYKLYLDDIRNPTNTYPITKNSDWEIVRSYNEFVKIIENRGLPFMISFDHDLDMQHYPFSESHGGIFIPNIIPYESYTEKTGYHAAKWLVEYCTNKNVDLPKCNVHSANPVGKQNIIAYLLSYEKHRSNNSEGSSGNK